MFVREILIALAATFAWIWFHYIIRGPIYPNDMKIIGKTALITGGNSGIGKLTAIEMAKRGAKVIIASRDLVKSQAAKQQIIEESKNSEVHAYQLDLSDFQSVRDFAKLIIDAEDHLDYLINNAGTGDLPGKSSSGINKMFAVNHFGHFLLTNLLLKKFKIQSVHRPVRIINLSSTLYRLGSIDDETMYSDPSSLFELYKIYSATKLANIYFTIELHERLVDYNITTYAAHPGVVATGFGLNFPFPIGMFVRYVGQPLFLRTPFYGTQTTLYCALDDEVTAYSGGYFSDCAHEAISSNARNKTLQKWLWKESARITGLSEMSQT